MGSSKNEIELKELVQDLAIKHGITYQQAKEIVLSQFRAVADNVVNNKGKVVKLNYFGKFRKNLKVSKKEKQLGKDETV